MRALVTGGAGFIGSNLVDALVARGDRVVVLDDLSGGFAGNVHPDAELIRGDVADSAAVAGAMAACEVVFHLAALGSVSRSVAQPLATDRANIGGTLTVLDAARSAGVRRVIVTSSSSVYGGAAVVPTPESAPLAPRSPYAVTKMAGEHYARVYWELHGLETVVIRPFNVYGPRQRPDSQYAAVIPLFIAALRGGQAPIVHGDGGQSRDFAYVDDAVAAFLAAAGAPTERCAGKAYNVAGGAPHTLLDLLTILEGILGVRVPAHHVEPRPGDIRHSCADLSAAAADLGWAPQVPFAEGLRRTVAWSAAASSPAVAATTEPIS